MDPSGRCVASFGLKRSQRRNCTEEQEPECGVGNKAPTLTMAWTCLQNGPEPYTKDSFEMDSTWLAQKTVNCENGAEGDGSDMGR